VPPKKPAASIVFVGIWKKFRMVLKPEPHTVLRGDPPFGRHAPNEGRVYLLVSPDGEVHGWTTAAPAQGLTEAAVDAIFDDVRPQGRELLGPNWAVLALPFVDGAADWSADR
jgi:hypothetical protein